MAAALLICVVIIGAITGTTGQQVNVEPKVYCYPGQTVNLSCVLTDITGIILTPPQVSWIYEPKEGERTTIAVFDQSTNPSYPEGPLKDRVSFSPSPPVLTSPSIQISGVKETDQGNYICSFFTFPLGTIENTTNLEMLESIVDASVTPSTNQPEEGNSVNLTCEAAGSVFTRKWMKNGTDLTETENMTFYNAGRVLSFLSLKKTDGGEYSCILSNPLSSDEAKYNMVLNYEPSPPCPAGCIARIVICCVVLIAVCVVLFEEKHNRDRQKSQRETELQQRNNSNPPPANTEQEEKTYENISPVCKTIE